ncbi:unnamed protein product [Triticum aestivum]|uniref:Uncharacterized protein n=1 Tax=Triticum aestivum TaxID=4565 RepID=A0A7H4LRH3_WHEAT|nr:unnamed protein product [Triticum aestivum]
MADSGDEAERCRRARSDAARKRGARRWLNHGARPPPAFNRSELDEFELERARRRRASSGNWSAGSSSGHGSAGCSSAGASSSRLVLVKREPEEAVPDAPPRRGVIGPEDYLPPGQEELLERVVLERSARDQAEMEERIRRELEYERLFLETGLTASQAHASKEADLRVMKAEQAKLYIEVDSDSD